MAENSGQSKGGIGRGQIDPDFLISLFGSNLVRITGIKLPNQNTYFPGVGAINTLRINSNVAGTETNTIGADVYEFNIVNTSTGVNVGATGPANQLNNVLAENIVTLAAHGLAAGTLIAVGTEIMKIRSVIDVNTFVVIRGWAATTIAVHADGALISKGAAFGAGRIPVGLITTLTPAAAGPALAATINFTPNTNKETPGSGAGQVPNSPTQTALINAVSLQAGAEVLIWSLPVTFGVSPQTPAVLGAPLTPLTLACSTTMAGGGNVWTAAAMFGGVGYGTRRESWSTRAAVAAEVTLGVMEFFFPFAPTIADVQVVTSAGAIKVFNGSVIISLTNPGQVTVSNTGGTSFAATDSVSLLVQE